MVLLSPPARFVAMVERRNGSLRGANVRRDSVAFLTVVAKLEPRFGRCWPGCLSRLQSRLVVIRNVATISSDCESASRVGGGGSQARLVARAASKLRCWCCLGVRPWRIRRRRRLLGAHTSSDDLCRVDRPELDATHCRPASDVR